MSLLTLIPSETSIYKIVNIVRQIISYLNNLNLRTVLSAPATYYVRTDGSDSNTGLTDTAAGAFLTIQHAYDVITGTIDLGGQTITIQVRDGTYTGQTQFAQPWAGGGSIIISGNAVTPSNVIISISAAGQYGFINTCTLPGSLTIKNMKITTSGSAIDCIRNVAPGEMSFANIIFGACANAHLVSAMDGAIIKAVGDYSITGNAVIHGYCQGCANLLISAVTVTLSGTPAFSAAFVFAERLSLIDGSLSTFSGAATGTRYNANANSVINTGGGGATYFPGNVGGSTATGAQYV
jgi:hypothetical protein